MMTRKTTTYTILLIGAITCISTYFLLMPATIKDLEACNPLFGSVDFIAANLHAPEGIINMITVWLTQWFYNPLWGSTIISALVILIGFLTSIQARTRNFSTILTTVPVLCLAATMLFPDIAALIQCNIALSIFLLYIKARERKYQPLLYLLCILFWPLLGNGCTIALLIACFITDLFDKKKVFNYIYPVLTGIIVYYLPRLWSLFISYIPAGEQTNFNLATPTAAIIIYTALIPYSAPLIGKYIKRTYSWMNILCCLVPAIAIPVHFLYHDKYALEEDFHNLEQAAEAGDWNTVKELTNNGKAFENGLYLRYALLAENKLGTLSSNLFNYPVNSTVDLFFWHTNQKDASFFNGLFYKNLGVADEYMHQIFEMGTTMHPFMSARTIRHLTEAACMQGDSALTKKYIQIAQKSQRIPNWKNRIQNIQKSQTKHENTPNRTQFFIGTYLPRIEFTMMLEDDSTNTERMNYMLYSLLLEKEITKFGYALKIFENKLPEHLPKAYDEAFVLLKTMDPKINLKYQLSEMSIKEWLDFLDLKEKNQQQDLIRKYRNTYWYYYFFIAPKELK